MGACSMHELRSARRAPPTGDPRPAAQRRAPRRRSRGRAEAQPARRVEAPAGAARRGAGRRASRRPAADVPPAAGAAGRDRRVAGALPPAVDPLARPPRWIPGGEPMTRDRSEEHTSELQSLMRNSYAVFCLKTTNIKKLNTAEQ